jgi:hypothetical protein
VDLPAILANAGFEDDLHLTGWTVTLKNGNYAFDAAQVSPDVVPFGHATPLLAPAGQHFVGVLNPADGDVNGRVVHEPVAGSYPTGTVFTVTVLANRGRLAAAGSAAFPTARTASELTLQFFAWSAGAVPAVNPSTDDWSRKPKFILRAVFTDWAENGAWAAQTFHFTVTVPVAYVSLAVTGKNHRAASYVAFDILTP